MSSSRRVVIGNLIKTAACAPVQDGCSELRVKKPPLRGNSVRFVEGVRYPSGGRNFNQQSIKDDVDDHYHTTKVRFIILVE